MHAPLDEDGERVKKYSSRLHTPALGSHESILFAFAAHSVGSLAPRSEARGALFPRHSGAQAKPASPESIPTACGYGFRPSPLSRLGRNDELKALAPSNTSSFPRRVFCARAFALSLHSPQRRGGGAPRVVRVLARHPLGLHVTRQARRW